MRPEEKASLTGFLTFAAALTSTVATLVVLAQTVDVHQDFSACLATYALQLSSLKPEPLERLLYISGLLLFPAYLLGYASLLRANDGKWFSPPRGWLATLRPHVLWGAATAAVFAWSLFVMAKNGSYYLRSTIGLDARALVALGAAAALAAFVYRRLTAVPKEGSAEDDRWLAALLRALCLSLIGAVAISGVFGLGAVTNTPDYTVSFNAVFYAMVQVYRGKALLVDLNHQYGLYPHFLEPLFKLVGLSVLKFTLVMAALNTAALLLLCRFLEDIAANRVVRYLGCAAVVTSSLLFGAPPRPDAYFQYYPVRIVFPALVLFLIHRALRRRSPGWYFASLAAAALAVLWNADTGLVGFAAWAATMAFDACCARQFRQALLHVLRACVALVLAYGLFATYLLLRYGSWPRLAEQFSYQGLFYFCGYQMEPMPLAHPWTVVLLVYAAGLLCAALALVNGAVSVRVNTVFFLSVMGAGLFSYYQGRSVDSNLLPYCAVLVTIVFADTLSRRVRQPGAWDARLLLAGILLAWSLSIAGLGRNLDGLYAGTRDRLARTLSQKETKVTRGIALLKRTFAPGQKVLILSGLSGVFYLETDTRPPLDLPGCSEMILARDYRTLGAYLSDPETTTVVIDSTIGNNNINAAVYESFRIKEYYRDLLLSIMVK